MKKAEREAQQKAAKEALLKILAPGDTVHTILRHCSRSGMMRHISVFKGVHDITYFVGILEDRKRADDGGLKVGGCGMDMGYSIVYSLSSQLFRDNFYCIGEGCPANDHANPPYPERKAGSMKHSDAGYALRHEWL